VEGGGVVSLIKLGGDFKVDLIFCQIKY
jgi:hypothetical protein